MCIVRCCITISIVTSKDIQAGPDRREAKRRPWRWRRAGRDVVGEVGPDSIDRVVPI